MAVDFQVLMRELKEHFPEAEIDLIDTVGDQNHYQVTIISERFAGLSKIQQHRLVNDSLAVLLKRDLHALSIKTKTK
jgi:stress-induced morphogen